MKDLPYAGRIIYPEKFIWSIITLFWIMFSYFVFKYDSYLADSLYTVFLPIIAPIGTLWSASHLLPLCHTIQLTPYGIHITKYFKTKYFSWKEIENIEVGYKKYGNFIGIRLNGKNQLDRFLSIYDIQIDGFYNISKSSLVTLMYSYKYQNSKNDLDWSDPAPPSFSLFILPETWGRHAAVSGEKISKKNFWERIKLYRNT